MKNLRLRLFVATALAAAIVAGCGGGDGGNPPAPDISSSVSALLDFMNNLIAGTSETTEPIDIDGLTLATDDTGEPVAF